MQTLLDLWHVTLISLPVISTGAAVWFTWSMGIWDFKERNNDEDE